MMTSKNKTAPRSFNSNTNARRVDPKRKLAEHAVAALARLGYAQTSLREIAKSSGLSVGIIHYHFKDKVDLIAYCTQLYKEEFIREMDASTSLASTAEDVIQAVIDRAVSSVALSEKAEKHRLWYDIRAQAMFDERFRAVTNEIEVALIAMGERINARLTQTGARVHLSGAEFYVIIDGFFRFYFQRQLTGDPHAAADFRKALEKFFKLFVTAPETKHVHREPPAVKHTVAEWQN